jgi:hypothetical protein
VSLVVTATRAPVVVAPSMNQAMWEHPAVQRNVALVRGDGAYVIEPGTSIEVASGQHAELQAGGAGVVPLALDPHGQVQLRSSSYIL